MYSGLSVLAVDLLTDHGILRWRVVVFSPNKLAHCKCICQREQGYLSSFDPVHRKHQCTHSDLQRSIYVMSSFIFQCVNIPHTAPTHTNQCQQNTNKPHPATANTDHYTPTPNQCPPTPTNTNAYANLHHNQHNTQYHTQRHTLHPINHNT